MGMFDTIHTERGCGQVKCFGNLLAELRVGDAVVLHRALTSDEHLALHEHLAAEHGQDGLSGSALQIAIAADPRSGALLSGEPCAEQSYEVRMAHGGGFVHVRSGVITGWDGSFDPLVPCFDSHGRPVPVVGSVGAVVAMDAVMCEECAGTPDVTTF